MNARQLLRRVREEQRSSASQLDATAPASGDAKVSSSDGVSEPAPISVEAADRAIWDEEALLVRRWKVGDSELQLYEDPMGKFAAGNGATLWDCSLSLARALEAWRSDWTNLRVLELGSGLGLVSMTLACLGANVVASERAIAVSLLVRNLEANGFMDSSNSKANRSNSLISSSIGSSCSGSSNGSDERGDECDASKREVNYSNVKRGSCQAATLDWGKDPLPLLALPRPHQAPPQTQEGQASNEHSSNTVGDVSACDEERRSKQNTSSSLSSSSSSCYDVVVGADLAFPSNRDYYDVLADTLAEALGGTANTGGGAAHHPNGVETPLLVEGWLAHESRRPEVESAFWHALASRGISAWRVDAHAPPPPVPPPPEVHPPMPPSQELMRSDNESSGARVLHQVNDMCKNGNIIDGTNNNGNDNDDNDDTEASKAWRVPIGTACQDAAIGIYRLRLAPDWRARQAAQSWPQVD